MGLRVARAWTGPCVGSGKGMGDEGIQRLSGRGVSYTRGCKAALEFIEEEQGMANSFVTFARGESDRSMTMEEGDMVMRDWEEMERSLYDPMAFGCCNLKECLVGPLTKLSANRGADPESS